MTVVLGSIVVLVSVLGGFMWAGGPPLVLFQPAEFLIIGGAAIGALVISTPMSVQKAILSQAGRVFTSRPGRPEYLDLLAMLHQLFRVAQQSGLMALEQHADNPRESEIMSRYPRFLANHHAVSFLTDSIKVMMLGGIAEHDLEALMDEDLHVHHAQESKPSATLARVGDALPGLGIVAAVLGVVITMQSIDGPPAEIGHHVGAALIGTFIGILLCYGFVGPMATNLEHIVADEHHYLECLKVAVLSLYKGLSPVIAVEFARRVLPSEVRPSFEETEQHCRTAKAGATEKKAA